MLRGARWWVLLGVVLGWPAWAQSPRFGAGLVPAVLPRGGSAVYGFGGAPELGAGFRQGFGSFEFEALGRFDYLDLALAGTGRLRWPLGYGEKVTGSFYVGVGLAYDTGSTYYDADNFRDAGVRLEAGTLAVYPAWETVRLVATADLFADLFVHPGGGYRLEPLVGGGTEVFLADGISAFVLGQLGVDLRKEPGQSAGASLGYGLRVGLGFRLF